MILHDSVCSFCWEAAAAPGRPGASRLLAVGAGNHLKLLEVEAEPGASVSPLPCWEGSEDQLLEVIREQDPGESRCGGFRPPLPSFMGTPPLLLLSGCRRVRAAVAAPPLLRRWPLLPPAQRRPAAEAVVATGRGGASDGVLLQRPAE